MVILLLVKTVQKKGKFNLYGNKRKERNKSEKKRQLSLNVIKVFETLYLIGSNMSVIPNKLYFFKDRRDKTMVPNDDTQNYPFYRLQLVVVTFKHLNNQPKFNESPQSC